MHIYEAHKFKSHSINGNEIECDLLQQQEELDTSVFRFLIRVILTNIYLNKI